ncbi:MAG: hypothetical protein KDB38_07780 [Nocardioidaceae bacterium]|nr:hypothetical protein [Nocardioidaceae bacterium]MCO5324855.1 hypothetical protein [Nocardioidaceae bacterium]
MLFFQDPTPAAEDVTAGGLGAIVFIFLILSLVAIGYFMSRQLKKAQAHKEANTYGDPVLDRRTDAGDAEADSATRE